MCDRLPSGSVQPTTAGVRGPRRVVTMWRDAADPDNTAAIARWCAAHPGEPAPSENDPNVLIVMRVIHDPPTGRTVEDRSDGPCIHHANQALP